MKESIFRKRKACCLISLIRLVSLGVARNLHLCQEEKTWNGKERSKDLQLKPIYAPEYLHAKTYI